jgi:hypothetical protein
VSANLDVTNCESPIDAKVKPDAAFTGIVDVEIAMKANKVVARRQAAIKKEALRINITVLLN